MHAIFFVLGMMVLLLTISGASAASTVYVNTTGSDDTGDGSIDNPYESIAKGIGSVDENGAIYLSDGIYSGVNNTNLTINKNLTIIGQSQSGTIIDGSGISYIFYINSGFNVTLRNITFTNVKTDDQQSLGGAISNYGNLEITNCNFINNSAYWGGAIYNSAGTLNVVGCTFTGNTGPWGGAIRNNDGAISVTDSIFQDNYASNNGGAINSDQGYASIKGCTFINNNALNGGAIVNYFSTTNANFNRFFGDTATSGNEIYNLGGTVNAENNWWGSNNPIFSNLLGNIPNPTHWLYMTINSTPEVINDTETSLITVSFNNRFDGTNVIPFDPSEGHIPDTTPVDFSLIAGWLWPNGSLSSLSAFTFDGIASVLFTASSAGVQDINATTDNQTVSTHVNIDPAAYLTISKEFRDAPWGSVITTAYYNQKIYALVKVRNSGPDSSSFSVLDILSGLNWTGNYYVLSAVGSILPTPESWVLNDPYNTFNGTHWTVPHLSTMIGSSRWLAIECIVKAVGVVSNEAQTVNQTAYAYNGFASATANMTTVPTPTKTFTLSVKNTGTGRIKAVYYVTVYRPDNAAPIFKKYVFYLNPGKSTSFNIGTYAVGTAISTDEMVYNFVYSMRTVSLVNTWSATGLVPYVQNYVVAKVPASRSKGAIARKRFWINPAALGVQIVVPPKLM